jgi:hypothetical protein
MELTDSSPRSHDPATDLYHLVQLIQSTFEIKFNNIHWFMFF